MTHLGHWQASGRLGNLTFAPATITFLTIPAAAYRECRLRH
jgi:hypothetical protein